MKNLKNQSPNSSWLSKMNWNENNSLTVWIGENVYLVSDVSKAEAAAFLKSESPSRHFNQHFRPKKSISRVG